MTTPSNANTSGLEVVAFLLFNEHGQTKASTMPPADGGDVAAYEPLVTAASAQARIAELEQWQAAAIRSARIHDENIREFDARATAAEARADRLAKALDDIVELEPRPFEGGLDMEAIRSCDECKRYEGHPVQHGICNTHRRPMWDREKHDGHEKVALGYRAKSIARAALQQEG